MALALVGSGWTMLVVLGVSHVFSRAQTGELVFMTVPILKMWIFPVLVPVSLVLTAVVLVPLVLLASFAVTMASVFPPPTGAME